MRYFRKLWRDTSAVTAVEYAFIGSLIALVAYAAMANTGVKLSNTYQNVASAISGSPDDTGGGSGGTGGGSGGTGGSGGSGGTGGNPPPPACTSDGSGDGGETCSSVPSGFTGAGSDCNTNSQSCGSGTNTPANAGDGGNCDQGYGPNGVDCSDMLPLFSPMVQDPDNHQIPPTCPGGYYTNPNAGPNPYVSNACINDDNSNP